MVSMKEDLYCLFLFYRSFSLLALYPSLWKKRWYIIYANAFLINTKLFSFFHTSLKDILFFLTIILNGIVFVLEGNKP